MARILPANQVRPGHLVEYENTLYEVKQSELSPPTGGTITKLVLQNIDTNAQKNLSVDAALKFKVIDGVEEEFEYMYDDGTSIFTSDGEEFPVSKVRTGLLELIAQAGKFRVIRINDEIYTITLPQKATVKIKNTQPALRGQTAKSTYKPATLYNGWIIQVPAFIEADDEVIVDTTELDHLTYAAIPT
ncbi:MAG: hypothetical protein KF832_20570 [Caldilineaceae bacterium]|nr:hypothetical protein [Caldilineaceae bacterium]